MFLGYRTHYSPWQFKESHRCCFHGHPAPLAKGDSWTSTILTPYEPMRLRSLQCFQGLHEAFSGTELIILHDNSRSHNAAAVTDLLRLWKWEILEHPTYSSDMSPCDSVLFSVFRDCMKRLVVQNPSFSMTMQCNDSHRSYSRGPPVPLKMGDPWTSTILIR